MASAASDVQSAAAVSVRAVSMVYDGVAAVDSASFDLPAGKFLTILGPSGSGKTTLLRLIAGFQQPTSGEIFIGGKPVSAVPAHKRSVGMVFQKLALFPHMTAADNVAFPLKMRRRDARQIDAQVDRYLSLVKLGGLGGRRTHELSGGQQQRVAIARALVFEPEILLLDEPLAALDRKLRDEMQLEFRRIQRELGVTTINVTHDQREALVVSDEIIVMNDGRIQQKAAPVSTYRRPANPFVANFIGVTNFLRGPVASVQADGVAILASGVEVAGVTVAGSELEVDAAAIAAIRAEQVRIGKSLKGLDTILEAEIVDAIFEGERTMYEARCAALGDLVLRIYDHDAEAHAAFAPGDGVKIGWNRRDVSIFSA